MTSLTTYKAALRKAEVFRKSRKRIVNTDLVVERVAGQRDSARREVEGYRDLLSSPILKRMREQFLHHLGAELGHALAEKIHEEILDNPELNNLLIHQSLHELSRKAGFSVAGYLADILFPELSISYRMDADSPVMGRVMKTRIDTKTVNICHKLDVL
jgi:hypothetical protein